MSFEILAKDLMGRLGRLTIGDEQIETPTVMPVINSAHQLIKASDMAKYGAEILITNAYIIYRNEGLRGIKDVHELLGWNKPIMTDSGAFQCLKYGDVKISNAEIIKFQLDIGSDIITPLDVPTPPSVGKDRARSDVEETLNRMRDTKNICPHDKMLAGPIQGSTYLDLREHSAKSASDVGFDIYSIGGVVPLLESYQFEPLVDIISHVKKILPPNVPVHLFGAGHPMFFALAVALGCDLFDSAAYAIYAKDRRYLTADGTYHAEELRYLPCSCPVCVSSTEKEIRDDDRLLAAHNLYVTFSEIRAIKQSIREGNLWDLLERRCRSHPSLLAGLKRLKSYGEILERYDPASKRSTFFYLSSESAHRPEVIRYSSRLNRFSLSGKVLITTKEIIKGKYDHIFFVKPPFGPYPIELSETYPIGQSETLDDDEARVVALHNVLKLMKLNNDVDFVFAYDDRYELPLINEIKKRAEIVEL